MFYVPFTLNILFSSACGYFALFETSYVTANYLPIPPLLIQFTGAGLFLFAGFILFALPSRQKLIWGTTVMVLDVLWVITVAPLVLLLRDVFSSQGVELVMMINLAVAALSLFQYFVLYALIRHPDPASGFDALLKGDYIINSKRQKFWERLGGLKTFTNLRRG